MHVVLITSVLRPVKDHTVFSTNQRIEQTLKTIETVRNKIPEAYIVMIEGGHITEQEKEKFYNLVDHLFVTDITHLTKSPGEATLLNRYLTSEYFKPYTVKTLSKISGRYYLNDDFNWNMMPKDKFIIGFIPIAWMGRPLYNTRYYRIPRKYINYFIEGLARYIASKEFITSSPDIEHCFYQHNIIKHDEVYCPKRLGVCGLITGTNEFMSE